MTASRALLLSFLSIYVSFSDVLHVGCPQCVTYEREARKEKGKKIPEIKKRRVPPAERAMRELEKEAAALEKKKKKALKEVPIVSLIP